MPMAESEMKEDIVRENTLKAKKESEEEEKSQIANKKIQEEKAEIQSDIDRKSNAHFI